MTRSEAIDRMSKIITDLEQDLLLAQTRSEHIRISQRIADAEALKHDLAIPPQLAV